MMFLIQLGFGTVGGEGGNERIHRHHDGRFCGRNPADADCMGQLVPDANRP